jgi:transitional endoplasmic reticulum ATPase
MPHFGFTSSWSWLAYRVGSLARVGVTGMLAEFRQLTQRTRVSSRVEKSAWMVRSVTSCVLVGAEVWLCLYLVPLGIVQTAIASAISWAVLFILPKPTPRLPLFGARLIIAGTTSGLLQRTIELVLNNSGPRAAEWKFPLLTVWFSIVIALFFWALFALFRRHASVTVQTTNSQAHSETRQVAHWTNIPQIKLQDVGGIARAKQDVLAIAANRLRKPRSGIVQNGILLYGPQGTGKNLLAEATAGEFGVNFHHVRCTELVGQNVGSGAERIRGVFESAAANRPIVLFLDEIDSIGSRKQEQGHGTDSGGGGREYNSLVTQLMQSIDQYRQMDGLLIVAATNYLDGLEPTLIRDGRFDARIRLDLPSESERAEILAAQLRKFRWKNHDLTAIAKRTPGWSPARLKGLVDRTALCAQEKVIEERHLIEALESTGGRDQGSLEPVGWDDVVLPAGVVGDLRALLDLMKPGRAEELSLPAPTGLILVGPPGTGKTLVAKLIASQAKRSFYAVSPSDVLGSAVGGSVKRLSEIFRRAKDNAPSIVFFDEMDGLFPELHGQMNQHDVQLVEQALIEISALKPEHQIFLVGTTNYLDRIDPRILRGGRFSEKVVISVPDEAGYRKLVLRYLGKARLVRELTVQALAEQLTGMAPADLEATIQSMKRVAMRRMDPNAKELPPLSLGDLDEALGRVQPRF